MGLLYKFAKYGGRLGLPFYFGRLEINGRENIPKDLPYIITPNHQSAFLDAILMGVYNHKPVHFLSRSDIFVKPFISTLTALNMMPVYRIRDGYEKLSKNEEVFAVCDRLLAKDLPILIFPEGNMDDGHYLRPLTKGTSRMAIQAQLKIEKDVMILPVGINYFHHERPRYKCIINFGKPIKVRDYLPEFKAHKARGLIKLRNDLSAAIKELLLIPEKDGHQEKRNALNRKNENYNFLTLRSKIARGEYDLARYYPSLGRISPVLTIFNPLSINMVNYLLRHVIKDRQFSSSLKYALGLYLSVIWWSLLFLCGYWIFDLRIALTITVLSIIMLFIRSELRKFSDPI